jgi:hypothetical protein
MPSWAGCGWDKGHRSAPDDRSVVGDAVGEYAGDLMGLRGQGLPPGDAALFGRVVDEGEYAGLVGGEEAPPGGLRGLVRHHGLEFLFEPTSAGREFAAQRFHAPS